MLINMRINMLIKVRNRPPAMRMLLKQLPPCRHENHTHVSPIP